MLAAVLLARHGDWLPWLRPTRRGRRSGRRGAAAGRRAGCADSAVTRVPASPSRPAWPRRPRTPSRRRPRRTAAPCRRSGPARGPGGFGAWRGGLLDCPTPGPGLSALLAADARPVHAGPRRSSDPTTPPAISWPAGAPVMAVGGFNGTDPVADARRIPAHVAAGKIHYFIRGKMMFGSWRPTTPGGSRRPPTSANGSRRHYTPLTVDGVVVYDLTAAAEELIARRIACPTADHTRPTRPWMS